MDTSQLKPMSISDFRKEHSKTLYRSICMPSVTQSYSLCVEYVQRWFLSKFAERTFKSISIDWYSIFGVMRAKSDFDLLKRDKPSLGIIPTINWEFNNENLDSYPYGMNLYTQTGRFKESFFSAPETQSYLGIGMRTIFMEFSIKARVETRAQQADMYEFIKMACRVGFSNGEDVDLDFHIPYPLMVQLAKDNGFEVVRKNVTSEQVQDHIVDVPAFLRWLNMHSAIPFIYKFRALTGTNEFFLRMRNAYVHIRPTGLQADDGEREGAIGNNYSIELNLEVRFPAPKFYAYYSNNAHELQSVYGVWYQPDGQVTTCYTFKEREIPEKNTFGWPIFMSTTYEEELPEGKKSYQLKIDLTELLCVGDIGKCIKDCLSKGLSPAIFCELYFYNNGEYVRGCMDWATMTFTSTDEVTSPGTYIALYVDNDYVASCVLKDSGSNRIDPSNKPKTPECTH